jgi:hypothetical protein
MKRGKIPIREGKRLSEQYDAPIVIVFSILDGGATFNVMTYGATQALCRHAASLGDQIADQVLGGTISPAAGGPTQLPSACDGRPIAGPAEWAGRRKNGGTTEAGARRPAAAPDLLAAAKLALRHLRCELDDPCQVETRDALVRAVARAEGDA